MFQALLVPSLPLSALAVSIEPRICAPCRYPLRLGSAVVVVVAVVPSLSCPSILVSLSSECMLVRAIFVHAE